MIIVITFLAGRRGGLFAVSADRRRGNLCAIRQNRNTDTLINGGQNWDGKAFDFSLDAMQGDNLVYGCWGPSFFPYGSNTVGAPSAWPGLMLAFTLPYGSEGWTRQVKIAFELSGDIYFIRFKNGTIDKSWTKIAGPEN